MKNRIKIVKEEQGYVGYLLQDDVVTFNTPPYQTTIEASRALTAYIASKQVNKVSNQTSLRTPINQPTPRFTAAPPTVANRGGGRSCCGRG